MRRLLFAISLLAIGSLAQQRTFQNTQFDLSADLPFEDPSVLAQVEGVPTHHLKNELKPVKLQKPAASAVLQPQQPLVPQIQLPQPAPVAPAPAAPAAPPALPTLAPFTLPTLPPHPSLAPFTFPTHPPLPTLAPFTLPTLPPHPTIAPFTFPTPAPAPVAPGQPPVPQASDYDDTAPQKIAPASTVAPKVQNVTPQAPRQGQQVVQQQQQGQQQQQYFFSPEYVRYVQQYYPEHFRQNQQYYMSRMSTQPVQPQQGVPQGVPQQGIPQGVPQQGVAQGAQQGVPQGVQQGFQGFPRGQPPSQVQRLPAAPVQVLPPPQQPIVQPPNPQATRTFAPQLVNGVQTAVGVAAVQPSAAAIPSAPVPKKIEQLAAPVADRSHPPSRASNWFREEVDTKDCKKDLKKVALRFKEKFPSYLQKGGKDAALADLVEKRLIECDEKGTTGHWDKVDSLLTKVQLSKSEEHECRAGLIQEQISCQNLLNFSCQFTNSSYQFKLVPARIIIQEARQAEGGADKCRKVVRLVKKRLEG